MAADDAMTTARPHLQPTRNPRRHGFTLLELVLVMVLLTAALAAVAPSLRGFLTASRSRDAATQILALTRWARAQAVAEARVYRLNVDAASGSYWLTVEDGAGFAATGDDFGREFSLPPGAQVQVAAGSGSAPVQGAWIGFYPDGHSDTATLILTDAAGDVTQIACPSPTEPFRIVAVGSEAVR